MQEGGVQEIIVPVEKANFSPAVFSVEMNGTVKSRESAPQDALILFFIWFAASYSLILSY